MSKRLLEPCPSSKGKAPAKMFCSYELIDRSLWKSERPEWIVTTNLKTPGTIVVISGLSAFLFYRAGRFFKK